MRTVHIITIVNIIIVIIVNIIITIIRCGLHTINTWDDLLSVMANHSVRGYSEVNASRKPVSSSVCG